MKISVAIPCYNKENLIGNCVRAVLKQSRPPDELIVVDDGSVDGSLSVLQNLPVKLIVHDQNQGPAAARNTALKAASGDVILYIDSDAYSRTNLIENLEEYYKAVEDNQVGGVGGRGVEQNLQSIYDHWRLLHARQDYGLRNRKNVLYLFGLCMSYRRDVLEKIGGFDTFFRVNAGEDLDVGLRIRAAGYRLDYLPEAIVDHYHCDTLESLLRVQYNWTYWGYITLKRNHSYPFRLIVGTIRRLIFDTTRDLLIRRNPGLAAIDLKVFRERLKALYDVRRNS